MKVWVWIWIWMKMQLLLTLNWFQRIHTKPEWYHSQGTLQNNTEEFNHELEWIRMLHISWSVKSRLRSTGHVIRMNENMLQPLEKNVRQIKMGILPRVTFKNKKGYEWRRENLWSTWNRIGEESWENIGGWLTKHHTQKGIKGSIKIDGDQN